MTEDGNKVLFYSEIAIEYRPKDRWVGLRNHGSVNKKEQGWLNRIGMEQQYQLNLIPCIGIFFKITKWTKIREIKKKK